MSSSDDNSQKGTVHRKESSIFCSTPVLVQKSRRLSSISISAVETNSSSSTVLGKAPTKSRKRKQVSKARTQKRRRAVRRIDSDSEWETKSELSIREEAIPQRVSTQKAASTSESVLFKDVYGSPERVREAPYFFEDDRFESPVFRPIRRKLGSPKKIDFKENEGILVVEHLPTFQTRVDDVDEEADTEEEFILRKRSTVVTYPGTRKEKWHKVGKKIVECHVPLEKVWYPVATANLLWDNFVKDNYEKFSKYISQSPLSEHQDSQSSEDGECSDSHKSQSSRKTVFGKWGLKKPDLRVNATHGWWSKSSKKFVRVEDVYTFPQPEDLEFQKRDPRGRKMTLNEYLLKCRIEKENLRHCSLDSHSSVASQNTEGSRRPSNDLGTMQNEASPCENFEHEFQRLKVKSTTQSKRHTLTRSSLKIANNADIIDGSGAKQPVIVKNSPRIRALEVVHSIHREYVQKLLELCRMHYAD